MTEYTTSEGQDYISKGALRLMRSRKKVRGFKRKERALAKVLARRADHLATIQWYTYTIGEAKP